MKWNSTLKKTLLLILLVASQLILMSQTKEQLLAKASNGDANAMVELGVLLENENKFSEAKKYYEKAIEQKNSKGYRLLGNLYKNGKGVDKNAAKAVELYLQAGLQGDGDAYFNLADLYQLGNGIEMNPKKAIEYYEKAAQLNPKDYEAMHRMGAIYKNGGSNIQPDTSKAFYWLEKAANGGFTPSIYYYGELLYAQEKFEEAFNCFSKAAEKNNTSAILALGYMYYNGEFVEENKLKALQLIQQAANQGSKKALTDLQQIKNKLLYSFEGDTYNAIQKEERIEKHKYYLTYYAAIDKALRTNAAKSEFTDNHLREDYQKRLSINHLYTTLKTQLHALDSFWNVAKQDLIVNFKTKENFINFQLEKYKEERLNYTSWQYDNTRYAKEAYDAVCKLPQFKNCEPCVELGKQANLKFYSVHANFASIPTPWKAEINNQPSTNHISSHYKKFSIKGETSYLADKVLFSIHYQTFPLSNDEIATLGGRSYYEDIAFLSSAEKKQHIDFLRALPQPYQIPTDKSRQNLLATHLLLSIDVDFDDLFVNPDEISEIAFATYRDGQYNIWDKKVAPPVYDRRISEVAFFLTPQIQEKLYQSEWVGIVFKLIGSEEYKVIGKESIGLPQALEQLASHQQNVANEIFNLQQENVKNIYESMVKEWNDYITAQPFPKRNCGQPPGLPAVNDPTWNESKANDLNEKINNWYDCMDDYKSKIRSYISNLPAANSYKLSGSEYEAKWETFKNNHLSTWNNNYNSASSDYNAFTRAIESFNDSKINSAANAKNQATKKIIRKNNSKTEADRFFDYQRKYGNTPRMNDITIPPRPSWYNRGWY